MAIKMGDYNTLEVIRETPFAYILNKEGEEVFLHKKQAGGTRDLHEMVEVFLYYDNQRRITATVERPKVDLEHAAFCDVVDVTFKLGAFLNIGLVKDLLLSKDDLPFLKKEWPEQGDKVFVKMRASKNQLTAVPVSRYQINEYLKPETSLHEGDVVTGYNVYKAEEGNVFYTEQGHGVFVYFAHMRKEYRLGEMAEITITLDKGNHQYGGRIIAQKEHMIEDDAQRILDYLQEHGGVMPLTDKSAPELISQVFHMSKGAFKRALGSLYKAELVDLNERETRLRQS